LAVLAVLEEIRLFCGALKDLTRASRLFLGNPKSDHIAL
jgi:hypothetical protein